MRAYRITESRSGGLRLTVFENDLEVGGASAPTRSDDDREWLEEMAGMLGALEPLDETDGPAVGIPPLTREPEVKGVSPKPEGADVPIGTRPAPGSGQGGALAVRLLPELRAEGGADAKSTA
jgi:hypothetical protein